MAPFLRAIASSLSKASEMSTSSRQRSWGSSETEMNRRLWRRLARAPEAVTGRPVARPLALGVPRRPERPGRLCHAGRLERAGGSFLLPSPSLSRSAHI